MEQKAKSRRRRRQPSMEEGKAVSRPCKKARQLSIEEEEEGKAVRLGVQIVKLSLLDEAKRGFRRNFVGSPLSITIFLNLLASGAKAGVVDRLLKCLGSESKDELHQKSLNLLRLVNTSCNGSPILLTATGMWVDQSCSLKPAYEDVLHRIFQTQATFLDFQSRGLEVAKEVNSWVAEKTRGLINGILSDSARGLLAIVVNALYFKGVWQSPFKKSLTKNDKFYLLNGHDNDGDHVRVPFMSQSSNSYYYNSFDTFQLIKLPYRIGQGDERRFYMYIFLPHERDGLRNLIRHLDSDPDFLNQDFQLHHQKINILKIPKFRFECGFDASGYMKNAGFGSPQLGPWGIVETNGNPKGRTKTCHKCFIEVDEEGTKAAAVTYSKVLLSARRASKPKPIVNFIADHPFIFMIREDSSSVPFFFGAILNPR